MDFIVSRVSVPPAVILYAKGEIGAVGQDVLCNAIRSELSGSSPIVLDLSHARYVAEGQISGPIINALIDAYYSHDNVRKVAVVCADTAVKEFLGRSFEPFIQVHETEEQALKWLGVRREPRQKEPALYHYTRTTSRGREIDRDDYLRAFEQWFVLLEEHERYKIMVPGLREWWSQVDPTELPVRAPVGEFCRRMPGLPYRLHLTVMKSNLLYRMLYLGEPVRRRRCPGTKMKWGDGETTHHPMNCQCGGNGWLL